MKVPVHIEVEKLLADIAREEASQRRKGKPKKVGFAGSYLSRLVPSCVR